MFNMKAKFIVTRHWLHGLMLFLIIWPSVKEKKKKVKKIHNYFYKQNATQQLIEIHTIDFRKLIGHYSFMFLVFLFV